MPARYGRYLGRRYAACPPLPVELWQKIIAYAVDAPEYFTTSCEADTLPEFLAYHRIRPCQMPSWHPYSQSLRLRSQLRLVSHTWARIVSDCAAPPWHSGPLELDIISQPSFTGYHRVDLYKEYDASRLRYQSGTEGSSLMKLRPSPLLVLAISEGYTPFQEQDRMLRLFQGSPDPWASVKSLAYHSPSPSHSLILRLATIFTSLSTLILESTDIHGNGEVSLPHLHTLELDFDNCNYTDWSLPQLRHLIITNRRSSGEYRANAMPDLIVPPQFENLEALVLNRETVVIDSALWSRFPKLCLLGCADLVLSDGPPPDHPIRHLYLNRVGVYSLPPERFARLLRFFGGNQQEKKMLFICLPTPYVRQYPHWEQWAQFHIESQREGVEWRPISPSMDPDSAWAPLVPENATDVGEKMAVDWALELFFAVAIGIHYAFLHSFMLRSILQDISTLIYAYFLYLFIRRVARWL
ncbi:hypothetical protein FRC17_001103 [Serendipita sp. 399]|nr:hypothetical protein FRC17_001103 [Serendipita sp. 399]